MRNEILKIIQIALIIFIVLLAVYLLLILTLGNKQQFDCSKIDSTLGFKFDSCYDAKEKAVIFSVGKYVTGNQNSALKLNFAGDEFVLDRIPLFGKQEYYKYPAEQNPLSLIVNQLLRVGDSVCSDSKTISLEVCSEAEIIPGLEFSAGEKTNVSISLNQTISNISGKANQTYLVNFSCRSDWQCGGWEACNNGIQKRNCIDKNSCLYSINMPELEKSCSGCKENWKCSWSECENNITTPICQDMNNCGTEFDIPKASRCTKTECFPDFICSSWGECKANYSFTGLDKLKEVSGVRTRVCQDQSKCAQDRIEMQACSIKTEVYSKEVVICGANYIEIYSKSTNELLGRIKNNVTGNQPDIALSLSSGDINCNLCQNGVRDAGEQGVDCGGVCPKCKKQVYQTDYISNFIEWLRKLI